MPEALKLKKFCVPERIYLLGFMGILVTVFHTKLLTILMKTTLTVSYVVSDKCYR